LIYAEYGSQYPSLDILNLTTSELATPEVLVLNATGVNLYYLIVDGNPTGFTN
jgi:hypothetical protein